MYDISFGHQKKKRKEKKKKKNTVNVVIFAVVLFSRISPVSLREHFHFNIWWKHHKSREIKPSQISPPSPQSQTYLYMKYMVYTVICGEEEEELFIDDYIMFDIFHIKK